MTAPAVANQLGARPRDPVTPKFHAISGKSIRVLTTGSPNILRHLLRRPSDPEEHTDEFLAWTRHRPWLRRQWRSLSLKRAQNPGVTRLFFENIAVGIGISRAVAAAFPRRTAPPALVPHQATFARNEMARSSSLSVWRFRQAMYRRIMEFCSSWLWWSVPFRAK
jgi:hypothetical protein